MNTREPLPYRLAEGSERREICSVSSPREVAVLRVPCHAAETG